jgi:hypothetical protein
MPDGFGFGPDGYLYIDSAKPASRRNAQTLTQPARKILRIRCEQRGRLHDSGRQSVRSATAAARARDLRLWAAQSLAVELRFRDGIFFIGDVGGSAVRGGQYRPERRELRLAIAEGVSANPAFVNPIHAYPHGVTASITGGYVYSRRDRRPERPVFLRRLRDRPLLTLRFDGASWIATDRTAQVQTDVGEFNNPTSFGAGCARQPLCGRHRRRGLPADAAVASVDANDHPARSCGQRRLSAGNGGRPARRRPRRGLPQRRRRRRFIVYRPGDGADTVFGFVAGAGSEDRISVSAFPGIASFADVLSHATQVNADTVINLGGGDTLILRNWCAAISARTTCVLASPGDSSFTANGQRAARRQHRRGQHDHVRLSG